MLLCVLNRAHVTSPSGSSRNRTVTACAACRRARRPRSTAAIFTGSRLPFHPLPLAKRLAATNPSPRDRARPEATSSSKTWCRKKPAALSNDLTGRPGTAGLASRSSIPAGILIPVTQAEQGWIRGLVWVPGPCTACRIMAPIIRIMTCSSSTDPSRVSRWFVYRIFIEKRENDKSEPVPVCVTSTLLLKNKMNANKLLSLVCGNVTATCRFLAIR